jgi:hypothetical protein
MKLVHFVAVIIFVFTSIKINAQTNEEYSIYTVVDTIPEFPGGINGLLNYLETNINYPIIDKNNNTSGKVLINFIVETDGSLNNVRAIKGTSPTLLMETVRVI